MAPLIFFNWATILCQEVRHGHPGRGQNLGSCHYKLRTLPLNYLMIPLGQVAGAPSNGPTADHAMSTIEGGVSKHKLCGLSHKAHAVRVWKSTQLRITLCSYLPSSLNVTISLKPCQMWSPKHEVASNVQVTRVSVGIPESMLSYNKWPLSQLFSMDSVFVT